MYTRTVTKQVEFEGQQITFRFRRLKRWEFMELQPFFVNSAAGEIELEFEDQKAFFEIIERLLPSTILNLTGLTIDGDVFTYDAKNSDEAAKEMFTEIITEIYFVQLVQSLIAEIIQASIPAAKDSDAKKLSSTPSDCSTA